jgi:hypothetical protein
MDMAENSDNTQAQAKNWRTDPRTNEELLHAGNDKDVTRRKPLWL